VHGPCCVGRLDTGSCQWLAEFPRSASTCCRQLDVRPLESRGAPDRAAVVDPAMTRARQRYPAVAHVRRRAAGSFGGSMRLFSLIAPAAVLALATPRAQTVATNGGEPELKVVLLGTMGGPTFSGERLGISTLVIAGDERLLFDAGRSLTTGLARLNINPAG